MRVVTRVLLVSDSSTLTAAVHSAVAQDEELNLVAAISNEHGLTELVHKTEPDVVVIDGAGGNSNALVARIHASWPSTPIVLLAGLPSGSQSAQAKTPTGQVHVVPHPLAETGELPERSILVTLLPAVRRAHLAAVPAGQKQSIRPPRPTPLTGPGAVEIVLIGASTGGPRALTHVIGALPQDFPVPILVVQHMPASFLDIFASRLDRETQLSVTTAQDGTIAQPRTVYLAPGDRHLALTPARSLALLDTPAENSCKPAADVLFRSAAAAYKSNCLAVLLTGMGSDGTEGARDIVNHGGALLCQDQDSSVVWGMPGTAVRAGLAYKVAPLSDIAPEIIRLVGADR